MIRKFRKYNKWLMVGFAVLLMLTWLQGGTASRGMSALSDRTVGKLDGKKVKSSDESTAQREVRALYDWAPGLVENVFGSTDHTAWLLLSREAEQGGFVGDAGAGDKFLTDWSQVMAAQQMRSIQVQIALMQAPDRNKAAQELMERITSMSQEKARSAFGQAHMTVEEMDRTLAKAAGVVQMMTVFQTAPRESTPRAVADARKTDDSAIVDAAFLPANALAPLVPEPDEAALQAQFDKFKGNKPGEGDFGIGYLLPARVKLEYLELNKKAIEEAIPLDRVEVRKRYTQNHPSLYKGEFAAEQSKVESDMKDEQATRLMQEAQVVIQAEVSKATRPLERDGKYRKLPADWEASRPKLTAIAAAVQDQMSKSSGIAFPLPAVTVKSQWLTASDQRELTGIGTSLMHQGGIDEPFPKVISWTRELKDTGGQGPVALQVGVPLSESFFTDAEGDRFYVTVLGTREESAPDNVDEIHDKIVKDYKEITAFEKLRERSDEFRSALISGGVEGAVSAFAATPLPGGKTPDRPKVDVAVKVQRKQAGSVDLNRDPAMLTAIVDAAAQLDPKAAPDSFPPEKCTLVTPSPKARGLAVVKIRAFVPLTKEDYARIDQAAAMRAMHDEMPADALKEAFSIDALLKRHEYIRNDERVRSAKDLRKDKDEVAG